MPLTFEQFLECPQAPTCPRPPPPSVCGAPIQRLTFEGGGLGILYDVDIYCGEYLEGESIRPCAFASSSGLTLPSHPDCVPAPEPGLATALALGVLALVSVARRRR